MKESTIVLTTLLGLGMASAAFTADAQSFDGGYNGFKIGYNSADGDNIDSAGSWTAGYEIGYNWEANSGGLFGLDAYYDYNGSTGHDLSNVTGSFDFGTQAYGFDTKYGYEASNILYYAKLGYGWLSGTSDASGSDGGFHGGLGLEYRFLQSDWSMNVEWLHDTGDVGPGDSTVDNDNLTVGANYYF